MPKSTKKSAKKLTRVGVASVGVTLSAVYAILGIIYAIIYLVAIAAFGISALGIRAVFVVLIFPIIFAIIGFIAGALTALAYNFVAKYSGGIILELSG